MAYGLTALSNAGSLQIDGTNPNLSLVNKGVWYPSQHATSMMPQYQYTYIYHDSPNFPVLVQRGNRAAAGVWGVRKVGNQWRWEIYTIHVEAANGGQASVEWFIFDSVAGRNQGSGFGLEVYGANSSLIASAGYGMLKLESMASDYTSDQSSQGGSNGSYPQSYDGSRKFGTMSVGPFWTNRVEERGDSLSGSSYFINLSWVGALYWSGQTVYYIDHEAAGTGATYGWSDSSGQPSPVWVVDITNL